MKAALLDNKKVIGEVFEAPGKGYEIEVAGAFDINDYPVNRRIYKISRSKRNLEKARYQQPVSKVQVEADWAVWTFHPVKDC